MFLEKLYEGKCGLTHIFLSKFLSIFHQMFVYAFYFKDLKIFLNQCWYGLTQNVLSFYQNIIFLWKAHRVWCTYCLTKSLASSNQDTIRLEPYCPLKALFFYFKISLINHGQYGLTRIVRLGKLNQSLSKVDMVRFVLYLTKYSVNSYQDTIPFEPSCALKDSQ